MGPPEVLTQLEFIRIYRIRSTWAHFDHISLIRTRNHAPFLLLNSLLIEEFSEKKFENFLSTRLTSWEPAQPDQWISVEVHYSSRFKFGAPELVLVISLSSGPEIMQRFFCWIPYSSIFFSTLSIDWEQVQPNHCASLYGALILVILVILEPKSYLVRARKLHISPRHSLGPVMGHFVGFLQPTLSPFGFLVVKKRDKCDQLLTS